MDENKSFIEKYAQSGKKFNFKFLKFNLPKVKINSELFYKYFVFIISLNVLFVFFTRFLYAFDDGSNRYDIYKGTETSPTILLDTKTGLTWRNVECDSASKVPNCWQLMEHQDDFTFNLPRGELRRRKFFSAYLKNTKRNPYDLINEMEKKKKLKK